MYVRCQDGLWNNRSGVRTCVKGAQFGWKRNQALPASFEGRLRF